METANLWIVGGIFIALLLLWAALELAFRRNSAAEVEEEKMNIEMYPSSFERAAGPQLDAAVAQLVMGWTHMRLPDGGTRREYWVNPDGGAKRLASNFKPSTDFQTAWGVIVQRYLKRGYRFDLSMHAEGDWWATFIRSRPEPAPPSFLGGTGGTPELAICDAALLAAWEERRIKEEEQTP